MSKKRLALVLYLAGTASFTALAALYLLRGVSDMAAAFAAMAVALTAHARIEVNR